MGAPRLGSSGPLPAAKVGGCVGWRRRSPRRPLAHRRRIPRARAEGETKHELVDGVEVARAGGSPKHDAIAGNVIIALERRLRGRCLVFPSDQRIHVEATGLFTYPDVTVVCNAPRFHSKGRDTLVNPRVLVEVLSSSTEAYDRGAKLAHYQSIGSLEEYVLVTQTSKRVEHFRRLETGQWLLSVSEGDDGVLALSGLGCEVPLVEIYAGTELLDEVAGGGP